MPVDIVECAVDTLASFVCDHKGSKAEVWKQIKEIAAKLPEPEAAGWREFCNMAYQDGEYGTVS